MKTFLSSCAFLIALTAPPAPAAITATGDVSPANPSSWDGYTTGYIGKTNIGELTIDGGSDLFSDQAYLGYSSGATGTVTVDGAGSTWNNDFYLYVGYDGSGILHISNDGTVSNSTGYLGYSSGSTGTVTVDGNRSIWNCSVLYVGSSGSGTLNIINGGNVTVNNWTVIGLNTGSTGTINFGTNGGKLTTRSLLAAPSQLLGTGTIYTQGIVSDYDLVFDGTHGLMQTIVFDDLPDQNISISLYMTDSSNSYYYLGAGWNCMGSMTIQDGMTVNSCDGYLGYCSGSTGTATVNGTGSTWNCNSLYVGYSGSGTLNITGGGTVTVKSNTYVGYNTGSTGVINFGTNDGALITQSLFASPTQLTGTKTINIRGLVSDIDLIFDTDHGLNKTITFNSLPDQNITINLDLTSDPSTNGAIGVGWNGTASLVIQDGVTVNSYDGYLGCHSGSTGTATVDSPDSCWTISNRLYIGYSGSGTLNITDGGRVVSNSYGYIGYMSGSGTVTVDGAGSTWTNSNSLYVGYSGTGTLNITNGGGVSGGGCIGYTGGSGTVTVDGAGSTWTNSSSLSIGGAYGTGTLNITNGGDVVSNDYSYIGFLNGSGTVTVDGCGSTWTYNNHSFYVGYSGNGTLNVLNGGSVNNNASILSIGYSSDLTGRVTVDGVGSKLTCSRLLYVGENGCGTLNISNGGVVSSDLGIQSFIGRNSGSTGTITVDGFGSIWTCFSNLLFVGYCGNGTLNITNGGAVMGETYSYHACYIGYDNISMGTVTVDGSGSTWKDLTTLTIGYSGSGTLNLTNGGSVCNSFCILGYCNGSSGTVTIDGAGSILINKGDLYIGNSGSGTLNINNDGVVSVAGDTYVGYKSDSQGTINFGSSDGTLITRSLLASTSQLTGTGTINTQGLVSDIDLVFDANHGLRQTITLDAIPNQNISIYLDMTTGNNSCLGAAWKGTGTLTIQDGIKVNSSSGYLGYHSGSIGMATVDGAGSSWSNSGSLYVGSAGSGALNIINGGAVSVDGDTYVGYDMDSQGVINFGTSGGTLTTQSLLAAPSQLMGSGTINARGLVSDIDFVFDADHGFNQTILLNSLPGQNITINLNTSIKGCLGAGWIGTGSLTIKDGVEIISSLGFIGNNTDSNGTATISGPGSKWTNSGDFYIGRFGRGSLNINNGGYLYN
ncbi:MAG: hypothetical protein JXB10_17050 [Pirellulales bacterium]|nr:hypothetical protein [Pirellulales bacterium]